jgi:hypothetical protein
MSGLEVVGVVLGSLPLLVSTIEHYANGIFMARKSIDCERQANRVVRHLKLEQALFKNTVVDLVKEGSTQAGDMRSQVEDVREAPGDEVRKPWQDPGVQTVIKEKLNGDNEIFVETVQELEDLLEEIMGKFDICPPGKVSCMKPPGLHCNTNKLIR